MVFFLKLAKALLTFFLTIPDLVKVCDDYLLILGVLLMILGILAVILGEGEFGQLQSVVNFLEILFEEGCLLLDFGDEFGTIRT